MELERVAISPDGGGDSLLVERDDDSGMGWVFLGAEGVARRVSVASLFTRDQYSWEPTASTAASERERAAVQAEVESRG